MNDTTHQWKYLVRKPKSVYKQLFVKDRWVSARTLYGLHLTDEGMSIEELAADYEIPIEAVQEAIAYCESNPPEIMQDWAREEAIMDATGMNDPNYDGKPRLLSAEEMARLRDL